MSTKIKTSTKKVQKPEPEEFVTADQAPAFPVEFLQDTAEAAWSALDKHLMKTNGDEKIRRLINAIHSLGYGAIYISMHGGKSTKGTNEFIREDVSVAIQGIVELGGELYTPSGIQIKFENQKAAK